MKYLIYLKQGYDTTYAESNAKIWNDRMEAFMKRNKSKQDCGGDRECPVLNVYLFFILC